MTLCGSRTGTCPDGDPKHEGQHWCVVLTSTGHSVGHVCGSCETVWPLGSSEAILERAQSALRAALDEIDARLLQERRPWL